MSVEEALMRPHDEKKLTFLLLLLLKIQFLH